MYKIILLAIAAIMVSCAMAADPMFLFGPAVTPPSGVEIPFSGCDPVHENFCSWNLETTPLITGQFYIFFFNLNVSIVQTVNSTILVAGNIGGAGSVPQEGQIFAAGNWKIHITYDILEHEGFYTFSLFHAQAGPMELYGPAFPTPVNVSVTECVGATCLWDKPDALATVADLAFLRLYDANGARTNITVFQTSGNSTVVNGALASTGVSNLTLPQTGNYTVAIGWNLFELDGDIVFLHSTVPPAPPFAPVPSAPPITPKPPHAPIAPPPPHSPVSPPVTPPTPPPPVLAPGTPFEPPTSTIPETTSPTIAQAGRTTTIVVGSVLGAAVIGTAIGVGIMAARAAR